ncbi:MAG: glycosyltransferase family 2 protein [Leptolyngbyaceae cyanobacterium]
MSRPTISVIIPVHNREQYVTEAIKSILAQTCPATEIWAIDDGSTDKSADVIQRFGDRVHYHYQSNSGAATARNTGVELSQGDLLAFLDSDDLWVPEKLALQLAELEKNPDLAMVFGHVRQFCSPDWPTDQRPRITAEVMAGYHVGTLLVRRDAFHQVGPFETQWRVGEFVSWQAKATDMGLPMAMLPEVVMERRLHATNMGRTERTHSQDYLRIVRAALERRRSQAPISEPQP